MTDVEQGEVANEESGHRREISIFVNEQPVRVHGPKETGLSIKEAAIAQGLPIDLGFQLIEELPDGRTQVVGNGDEVHVHEGSRFLALAPDDNS